MKIGEIWKAKPNHPIRCKWDMIKLIRPSKDGWEILFFEAEETPEDEKYDDFLDDYQEGNAYDSVSYLSRERIIDEFYKIYQE